MQIELLHLGYVFNNCHYRVVWIYHIIGYYVGYYEPPLVRDSFFLIVTDSVHVTEHLKVPEQYVVLRGSFQLFVNVLLLVQGLSFVYDQT